MFWDLNIASYDIFKELISVSIMKSERWLACQHFIDNAPNAPPVNCSTVTPSLADLRSQVFWCSTESLCILIGLDVFLRQAKVSKFSVPVSIDQNILWLQTVAMVRKTNLTLCKQ